MNMMVDRKVWFVEAVKVSRESVLQLGQQMISFDALSIISSCSGSINCRSGDHRGSEASVSIMDEPAVMTAWSDCPLLREVYACPSPMLTRQPSRELMLL